MKEDRDLLPGSYLNAIVESGTSETSALPEEAIVNSEGKDYIFIQIPVEEAYNQEKAEVGQRQADKEKEEGAAQGQEPRGFKFKAIEITTGVSDGGYTAVILPEGFNRDSKNIVLKGAYDLLSKMNNSEEDGH